MIVSLVRMQPHWIPYFVCYIVANYASMLGQFFRPAKVSSFPAEAYRHSRGVFDSSHIE
jgi:hypothetical protein